MTDTLTVYTDTVHRWSPGTGDSVAPQITTLHLRKPFSMYLRIMDPSAGPLWQLGDEEGGLACRLSGGIEREQPAVIYELWTDFHDDPLRLVLPITLFGHHEWHDVVVRYSGVHVQIFLDGVLVDEDWPAGNLPGSETRRCLLGTDERTAWSGKIGYAALWARALSDDEITTMSGGQEAVAVRERELLGEQCRQMQYWLPRGFRTGVGDCMPFFHDGRFHLFYLADRHHHQSKWGNGAHQWAHISTTDLHHWEEHPLAVPITEEWEGSICTGSVFHWNDLYYAFYAARTIDGSPARLQAATSTDGIHFVKTPAQVTLGEPYQSDIVRDPVVFQENTSGLFHMLVTTALHTPPLASHHNGCLAKLVSSDLQHWEQREPFIIPGLSHDPECADYFYWHGWYYLIFSNNGVARYRMASAPLGPWQHPKVDTFDGVYCRVMKSAAFTGDRRIGAAFIAIEEYGGYLVFREFIQLPDGTLGTKFPIELLPPAGAALPIALTPVAGKVVHGERQCLISAEAGMGAAALSDVPENLHLTLRVTPRAGVHAFGLCVRAEGEYAEGHELRIEPHREKVGWRQPLSSSIEEAAHDALYAVEGLANPLTLEIILKDDLFDLCVDGRRTLIVRMSPTRHGNTLFFFVMDGTVEFSEICIRPLCQ